MGRSATTTAALIAGGKLEIGDGYRAKNSEFREEGIPFARVKNVKEGFDLSDVDLFPKAELDRVGSKISQTGDCVISMKGSVGRVAFVDESIERFVYSPQLSYWRSLDWTTVSPRFLRYWMQSHEFVDQCAQVKGSTDMADYVNLRDQRRMQISLPEIGEQVAIAEALGAFDDLIENNRRRIEILEEMARLLYRDWFVHFRFPGHEDVEMVDSELGPIPEGWAASTLGQVAENFDRLRKPLSKMQRAEMQGKYPYYGASKVFDYVNDFIFDGEYLLLGEDGTVEDKGGGPMLQLVSGKFWPNNHTHVLHGTKVSTRRLWCGLSGYPIAGHITGAAQPKITQANMNRIPIVLPDERTAEAADDVLDPMVDLRFNLLRQNAVLREARDLLLPPLVSGELDVSDLNLDDVLA